MIICFSPSSPFFLPQKKLKKFYMIFLNTFFKRMLNINIVFFFTIEMIIFKKDKISKILNLKDSIL